MKETDEYIFFFGSNEYLSNWYKSPFSIDEIEFSDSEQAFMYMKAMYFNDISTANKILNSNSPRESKKLGRQVANFNDAEWDTVKTEIMKFVLRYKFTDRKNLDILKLLLNSGTKIFVEASPYDRIWGIGLSEDNPKAHDFDKWKGTNLLGFVLTELRDELAEEYQPICYECSIIYDNEKFYPISRALMSENVSYGSERRKSFKDALLDNKYIPVNRKYTIQSKNDPDIIKLCKDGIAKLIKIGMYSYIIKK